MLYQRKNFRKAQFIIASTFVIIIAITTIPTTLVPNALAEAESVITQEEQLSKSLHEAVSDSDMPEIKRLISDGADVNKLEDNRTPLHIAVSNNSKDIVELLLENGANIDIQDETGRTPLFLAVQNNNVDIVKILLSGKADINIGNNRGQTPIDIALRQRSARKFKRRLC